MKTISTRLLFITCALGYAASWALGWPGAVSIDMFQTIREGFDSRYAGHYDPMAAVAWKLPLLFFDMPTAVAFVFALQALGYWLTFGLLAWNALRQQCPSVAALIVALAFSPPFFAFSIAIESNMQVAVWWGLSMALCMTARRPALLLRVTPMLWAGFVGRYGTVAAFFWVALFCAKASLPSWRIAKIAGLAALMAVGFQAMSYLVPKLVLRAPSSTSTVSVSQLFDMAGIYHLTGRQWIPNWCVPAGLSAGDVVASYDARNCVPMFWSVGGRPIFNRPKTEAEASELTQAWWTTISSEPMAYWTVKARFASALLLWSYDTCYGVGLDFTGGPHIGVAAPPDPSQHPMVLYALLSGSWLVQRGWIWILAVATVLCLAVLVRAQDRLMALCAALAGFGLLVPQLMFGQGASPRYLVPVFWMFMTSIALALPNLLLSTRARLRAKQAPS
jgi:hypothetical protein